MPGIIKVGKTTRNPNERVTELSNATGVPTPFLLAFKQEFENCHIAETLIHLSLEEQNFRVNRNREFFSAPLEEAIQVVLMVKSNENQTFVNSGQTVHQQVESNLSEDIYNEGFNSYYGIGDTIEDHVDAFERFMKASSLGNIKADKMIGMMHLKGHGCKKDENKALVIFKNGSKQGDPLCSGMLAVLYGQTKRFKNGENAEKVWCFSFIEQVKYESLTDFHLMLVVELMTFYISKDSLQNKTIQRFLVPLKNRLSVYIRERIKRGIDTTAQESEKIVYQQEKYLEDLHNYYIFREIYQVEELEVGRRYVTSRHTPHVFFKGIEELEINGVIGTYYLMVEDTKRGEKIYYKDLYFNESSWKAAYIINDRTYLEYLLLILKNF